jgi:acyl dehydratase
LNPIHLSDASAKLFGFKGAIAHGMWSLARCAADLDDTVLSGACEYQVAFKLPVFMPAWVMLEQWDVGAATEFCLRDNQGEKPHLTGRLQRRA